MKVCKDIDEWIEEEVIDWVERQETRCQNWPWPLDLVCSAFTFLVKVVTTIGRYITRTVCEVVTVAISLAALLLNAALAIPFFGALIRFAIRAGTWGASLLAGFVEGIGRAAGVQTVKKLRVIVVPLCVNGVPLVTTEELEPVVEATREIFRSRAQIDVIIKVDQPITDVPEFALDIGFWKDEPWMGISTVLEELGPTGSWFQLQTLKYFDVGFWNLIGFGNPIVAYIVREVGEDGTSTATGSGATGVSLGPFADWVAVEAQVVRKTKSGISGPGYNASTLAHEIGHALGLLGHTEDAGNLMAQARIRTDTYLSPLQVGLVRGSPKVTYL